MNEENEVIIEPKDEDESVRSSDPDPSGLPDDLPIDESPSSPIIRRFFDDSDMDEDEDMGHDNDMAENEDMFDNTDD